MERYRPPYWAVAFPLPAAPCSPSHHRQDEPAAWRVGPRASKAGWQAWTDEPYHHRRATEATPTTAPPESAASPAARKTFGIGQEQCQRKCQPAIGFRDVQGASK